MTKISTITGIKKTPYYNQNAVSGYVPPQPTIDYAVMTSGELRLALIKRQLDILANVYPDNPATAERRKAIEQIDNILYKGVHSIGSLTGSFWWGGEAATVAKEIAAAAKRQYAASYNHINGRKGNVHGAFELLSENPCNRADIERRMQGAPQSVIDAAFQACVRDAQSNQDTIRFKNDIRTQLNSNLEKSSHAPLYEFLTDQQYTDINNVNAVTGDKIQLHRYFATFISSSSGLERDNVRLWMRNGVMAHNATYTELGALSPEQTIMALASNPNVGIKNGSPSINSPIAVAILITIKVVAIIVASGIVIVAIIQAIKGKEPTAFQYLNSLTNIIGLGTGEDWKGKAGQILIPDRPDTNTGGGGVKDDPTTTTNTGGGLPSWALPAGAAAAAYLLLK